MKIGVGITAWNRPQYFSQMVASLERNDTSDTEFHLFQDGVNCRYTGEPQCTEESVRDSLDVFKNSKLPKKFVHAWPDNVSIAINQYETMKFLRENYEYFIFMEDDIVLSKNFMPLMKVALEQFKDHAEVASISPGFRMLCSSDSESAKRYLDKMVFSEGHFWVEGCWSHKWERVEKEFMPYYKLITANPYRKKELVERQIKRLFLDGGRSMMHVSQDQGKDWAIWRTGLKRLRMMINRATGIGDIGFHNTPSNVAAAEAGLRHYDGSDWHNLILSPKEELDIKEFKIYDYGS